MANIDNLNQIAAEVKSCQLCPLYKTATNPVPGNGNANAEILFIGEAPGFNEDQQGIPFCGAAGNLLNQLLLMVGLKREEVFVGNILKHRPPENREPQLDEIAVCTPFLKRQILIIKPKLIVTLGRFSMNYFIPNAYISTVHGKLKEIIWEGVNLFVFPIYHPAAALRNGQMMTALKEDFKRIPEVIKQAKETPSAPLPPPKEETKQESLF